VCRLPANNSTPEPTEIDRMIKAHLETGVKCFSKPFQVSGNGYSEGIGGRVLRYSRCVANFSNVICTFESPLKILWKNCFVMLPLILMEKTNSFTFALYITNFRMYQIQSLALEALSYHVDGPKFMRRCVDQRRLFLACEGDSDSNLINFGSFVDESN